MLCVKCGKKTENEQVFCAHCLEVMEAYPVKSEVHIQLPARPDAAVQKKQSRRKRPQNKDEEIARLRRKNRWLGFFTALLLLSVLVLVGKLYRDAKTADEQEIGKNYTYTDPTK